MSADEQQLDEVARRVVGSIGDLFRELQAILNTLSEHPGQFTLQLLDDAAVEATAAAAASAGVSRTISELRKRVAIAAAAAQLEGARAGDDGTDVVELPRPLAEKFLTDRGWWESDPVEPTGWTHNALLEHGVVEDVSRNHALAIAIAAETLDA